MNAEPVVACLLGATAITQISDVVSDGLDLSSDARFSWADQPINQCRRQVGEVGVCDVANVRQNKNNLFSALNLDTSLRLSPVQLLI